MTIDCASDSGGWSEYSTWSGNKYDTNVNLSFYAAWKKTFSLKYYHRRGDIFLLQNSDSISTSFGLIIQWQVTQ